MSRNVSFQYPGKDDFALRDVSFKIEKGQLCVSSLLSTLGVYGAHLTLERQVIVGTNGSGKSTILKLMVRLYDPTEGTILVNGQDIKMFKLADLRESMAILFQDYSHFPLTVRHLRTRPSFGGQVAHAFALASNRLKITSRLGTLRTHTTKPGSERQRDWEVPRSLSTR